MATTSTATTRWSNENIMTSSINSPLPLEQMCFETIRDHLGRSLLRILDGQERFLNPLGQYLAQFPPGFSQILREHLIEKYLKFSRAPRKEFMNIVLTNDVKRLKINSFSIHYNYSEWLNIMKLTTSIACLTVTAHRSSQHCPEKIDPFMQAAVVQWPELQEIRLSRAFLSDQTLTLIGRHCRSLRVLDLRKTNVHCSQLLMLFCSKYDPAASSQHHQATYSANPLCSSLEVLVLSRTKVRTRGVVAALRFCPRLISLGHCVQLCKAVRRLRGRQSALRLKLKHVVYNEDSQLPLKELLEICPEVEYLTILYRDKSQTKFDFSEAPSQFERITKLMLMHVNYEDVPEVLRRLPQLIELQVGAAGVDIFEIGRLCPHLETFHIIQEPNRHIFSPSTLHIKIFQKLQHLKVTCRLPLECACLIFMSAPLLRTVYLVRVAHLKDHHLYQWLSVNPLYFLETWTLLYASLTHNSARLLVEKCPRLIRLGILSQWDMRSWDFDSMLKEVRTCSLEWTTDGPSDLIVMVRQLEYDSSPDD